MTTTQIILVSRPKGLPTEENFKTEDFELPAVKDGEVLLEGMYYSVDPYMRGRMNDAKSYVPPFETGQSISGGVVARVKESKLDDFSIDDIVTGNLPWRKQMIVSDKGIQKIDATIAPPSYFLLLSYKRQLNFSNFAASTSDNLMILLNLSDVNLNFCFRSNVEKFIILIYEQTNFKRHYSTTFCRK